MPVKEQLHRERLLVRPWPVPWHVIKLHSHAVAHHLVAHSTAPARVQVSEEARKTRLSVVIVPMGIIHPVSATQGNIPVATNVHMAVLLVEEWDCISTQADLLEAVISQRDRIRQVVHRKLANGASATQIEPCSIRERSPQHRLVLQIKPIGSDTLSIKPILLRLLVRLRRREVLKLRLRLTHLGIAQSTSGVLLMVIVIAQHAMSRRPP
mmetsp:Transcript_13155/g.15949  ORF Transcript_13155/g.15949 Transcript_13155/m.15949 type:complete len:210 (+) Transcript_13155:974-1603(+)